jgi:hypothetical protein
MPCGGTGELREGVQRGLRRSSGTEGIVQVPPAYISWSQLKLPRVPLAAATADRLVAAVGIAGSTVVAAVVRTSGNSPVAPVSFGLRLIDTQL